MDWLKLSFSWASAELQLGLGSTAGWVRLGSERVWQVGMRCTNREKTKHSTELKERFRNEETLVVFHFIVSLKRSVCAAGHFLNRKSFVFLGGMGWGGVVLGVTQLVWGWRWVGAVVGMGVEVGWRWR